MRNALPLTKEARITADLFPLPPSPQNLPLFKTLRPSQTEAVLVRNKIGRIAFALDGRVQLLPINYVYLNGWIYGRTAARGYLPRNAPVTFQVDECTAALEWSSVIVHGRLDLVESESATTRGVYRQALSRIRRLVRPAVTDAPSVLFRDQLFGIQAMEIHGRASLPVAGRFFASSS